TLDRRGGCFVRGRETRARGGYERRPCASAGVLRPGNGQRATCNGGVGPGGEARPEERQARLEVQPGSDGTRSAGLCGAQAEVPRLSRTTGVQDGQKPRIIVPWLSCGIDYKLP